ncbi:MAG: hypothetical protein H0W67_01090 [Gemmatimonadales bacterium]|nr:hypothetical protein [Gemmatimonadales bacterium]
MTLPQRSPDPETGSLPASGDGRSAHGRHWRATAAAAGGIAAALFASLCCIAPLLFVALGVGAGLASTFEPLRPGLATLTVGLLALGFYIVYRRRKTQVGTECAARPYPPSGRRDQALLWISAAVALALLRFPE